MNRTRIVVGIVALAYVLAGCALQRASVAKRAQSELLGMSKANLLACAGATARAAVVEGLEVLTYASGGDTVGVATTHTTHQPYGTGYGTGSKYSYGTTTVSKKRRYCEVTFVLKDDVVTKVNYSGRTGGLLSKGEQCAFVVENCLSE